MQPTGGHRNSKRGKEIKFAESEIPEFSNLLFKHTVWNVQTIKKKVNHPISMAELNASPRLHLPPINHVVCVGVNGDF